ncbi:MAG: glycosyltransferase family 2 protein [Alphaproteobacteria bacterium]
MSEASPQVSVVLPTFNRGAVLMRALQSVLGQTFSSLEVIVVDDASADDTAQRVAALDDPRVRYIRHSHNRGAAAARNTGIAAARGPWIAFQDSDDEWRPDKLETQMALARTAPREAVIYSGFVRAAGDYMPHSGVRQREGDILGALLSGNFVSTQTLLVRKEVLEKAGGFDERLPRLQDWDLAIRLAETCPFLLVDEPLVRVHRSPDSISADAGAQARALALIFEKHDALFGRFPGSRFRVLTGFGLINLVSGNTGLARKQLREALAFRPRTVRGWGAFVFSWLLPALYGRLRGRGRRG